MMNNKQLLTRFFQLTTTEVLHVFSNLPHALDCGEFVFVPGTLASRILFVAHADTVFEKPPTVVEWRGHLVHAPRRYSFTPQTQKGWRPPTTLGLGADDRAGCAILWRLRHTGHSLLITDGEESGGIGAQLALEMLPKELADHQFAVQIDRRYDSEMVFYDCATPEFEAYMQKHTGFRIEHGTFSDISFLCPGLGFCGVNLATGYWNEHTSDEMLSLDAWKRTLRTARKLAAMTHPKFILPPLVPKNWFPKNWAAKAHEDDEESPYHDWMRP